MSFDLQIDSALPLWDAEPRQFRDGTVYLAEITCRVAPNDLLLDGGAEFTPMPHQDWLV
jgi:hypothetical protein